MFLNGTTDSMHTLIRVKRRNDKSKKGAVVIEKEMLYSGKL